MNKKLLYYGAAGFAALLLTLYLYITTFVNPSWERQAGLIYGYESLLEGSELVDQCTFQTKQGLIIIKIYKDKRYEILIDQNLSQQYLYSEGTWKKQIDVFSKRSVYKFRSSPIEAKIAAYRFKSYPFAGTFYTADQTEIGTQKTFDKHKFVSETFDFIYFEDFYLESKSYQKYYITKQKKAPSNKNAIKKTLVLPGGTDIVQFDIKQGATYYNYRLIENDTSHKAHLPIDSLIKDASFTYYDNKKVWILFYEKTFEIYHLDDAQLKLYIQGNYNTVSDGFLLTSADLSYQEATYKCVTFPFHGLFYSYYDANYLVKDCNVFPYPHDVYEIWKFKKTDSAIIDVENQLKYFLK